MAAKKKASRKKYGSSVGSNVKRVMRERKSGTLRSGRSKKKVKSRKQAIAIALSESRASGAQVPPRKKAKKKAKRKTKRKTKRQAS
jgi:hypothetical protein